MKRRKPRVRRTLEGPPRSPHPPGTVSGNIKIPPILLEGDERQPAPTTGPGQKYSLGAIAGAVPVPAGPGELPEAYGTGRLLLLARDPHCLYAHWDLASAQQQQYEALSADGHLVVRSHREEAAGPIAAEPEVQPGARHGFLQVPAAGAKYVAELGYYLPDRQWVSIAFSGPAVTPHETVSEDRTVEFATVADTPQRPGSAPNLPNAPAGYPSPGSGQQEAPAASTITAGPITPPRVGWIPALGVGPAAPGHEQGEPGRPAGALPQDPGQGGLAQTMPGEWTVAQERALADLIGLDRPGQAAMSSLELAQGAAQGFWFNLNAELIVYGATDPKARVSIGDRLIELRADGTFSCRFALPDGEYELAVTAVSMEGESRRAALKFRRRTEFSG